MTSAKLSRENNLIKYTEEHVIIQTVCSYIRGPLSHPRCQRLLMRSFRFRRHVFGRRAHRRTQEKNSATQGTLSSAEAILESLSNNDGGGDNSENVT